MSFFKDLLRFILGKGPEIQQAVSHSVDKYDETYKNLAKDHLHLVLKRKWFTEESTIGELFEVGKKLRICYILEDHDRLSKGKVKKHGETAIPSGVYEIRITRSPRFKRKLPILISVPGFSGVRIHPGNTAKDTEGCLLPGVTRSKDFVGQSKRAFDRLFTKLTRAKREGKRITIEVKG